MRQSYFCAFFFVTNIYKNKRMYKMHKKIYMLLCKVTKMKKCQKKACISDFCMKKREGVDKISGTKYNIGNAQCGEHVRPVLYPARYFCLCGVRAK